MDEDLAVSLKVGLTRRNLLAAATLPIIVPAALAQTIPTVPFDSSEIKALTFDIQGTVVDFYQPLLRTGQAIVQRGGPALDWDKVSAQWLAAAGQIIAAIRAGQRPWISAAAVYREALDGLSKPGGEAATLTETDKADLMKVWGQMVPWPDSVEGIGRLKRRYTVAALSNATTAGVIAVAKLGGLPFDAVLTGELVHAYKPSPEVYMAAVGFLGFKPEQIIMVACHKWDLKGAKAVGLKTAYVPRPLENGPGHPMDSAPEPFIDVVAQDFIDLAAKLGA